MEHRGHEEHREHRGPAGGLAELSGAVVDAGLKVHKTLGPGLLESTYEHCLAHELRNRGLSVKRQVALPIVYEGLRLEAGYRLDLLVEDAVVWKSKLSTRSRASTTRKFSLT